MEVISSPLSLESRTGGNCRTTTERVVRIPLIVEFLGQTHNALFARYPTPACGYDYNACLQTGKPETPSVFICGLVLLCLFNFRMAPGRGTCACSKSQSLRRRTGDPRSGIVQER